MGFSLKAMFDDLHYYLENEPGKLLAQLIWWQHYAEDCGQLG